MSWKGEANLGVQEGHFTGAPLGSSVPNPNQDVLEGGSQLSGPLPYTDRPGVTETGR